MDTPEALEKLIASLDNRAAFVAQWAARSATVVRARARAKHPGSELWGGTIPGAVVVNHSGEQAEVGMDMASKGGQIAAHKEHGGTIRARRGKYLAIPLIAAAAGKSPRTFFDMRDTVFRKTRRGGVLGWMDGEQFRAVFALVPSVDQKAEPWWPADDEFAALGERIAKTFFTGGA
ncbi:MAG: hypothetical protein VB042_05375 [Victivallaceae bacterium]|nr:hypothetical protein [Victivallaceae bacterium]